MKMNKVDRREGRDVLEKQEMSLQIERSPPLLQQSRYMSFEDFSENYSVQQDDAFMKLLNLPDQRAYQSSKDFYHDMYAEEIPEEAKCLDLNFNKTILSCSSENDKGVKPRKGKSIEPKENKGRRNGHWDLEENKRYHWFLEVHSSHFINKQLRRMDKIFKSMATFVRSRQAEQCRSHHQKMEKKFITFSQIIKHLRSTHYQTINSQPIYHEIIFNEVECRNGILPFEEIKILEQLQNKKVPLPPISPSSTAPEIEEELPYPPSDLIEELFAEGDKDSFINNVLH